MCTQVCIYDISSGSEENTRIYVSRCVHSCVYMIYGVAMKKTLGYMLADVYTGVYI